MREENCFTRLTLEQSDRKIVWEVPFEDVSGDDMMQAIYTIMVGMTFFPTTVYHSMAGYLEEYASDLYDIYDHQEENAEDKEED